MNSGYATSAASLANMYSGYAATAPMHYHQPSPQHAPRYQQHWGSRERVHGMHPSMTPAHVTSPYFDGNAHPYRTVMPAQHHHQQQQRLQQHHTAAAAAAAAASGGAHFLQQQQQQQQQQRASAAHMFAPNSVHNWRPRLPHATGGANTFPVGGGLQHPDVMTPPPHPLRHPYWSRFH